MSTASENLRELQRKGRENSAGKTIRRKQIVTYVSPGSFYPQTRPAFGQPAASVLARPEKRFAMAHYYYKATLVWLTSLVRGGWEWLNGLDRDEWMILLMVTAGLGILCMRGFGSRTNY